jgi:primosomal protein N' (replication factor Y)
MSYAEVVVDFPASRGTFCYAVPEGLRVSVGQVVWVPFGARFAQGIVLALSDKPTVERTKQIAGVIAEYPVLSPIQIELARWISERYLCSLFDAMALMLPPGFGRQTVTYFEPSSSLGDFLPQTQEQRQVLDIIKEKKRVTLNELERALGKGTARKVIGELVGSGVLRKMTQLGRARVSPKTVYQVRLIAAEEQISREKARLSSKRAHKQMEILEFLRRRGQPVSVTELKESLHCTLAAIKALEKRHLIAIDSVRVRRDPLSGFVPVPSSPPALTASQEAALKRIRCAIAEQPRGGQVFLLFGVTGSGKTEIYLQVLAEVVAKGKKGICLVPEIALTRQTVERFASRFPGRVAVLHSGLSLGQQFDQWQEIKDGNYDVVVGPRSALFAPLPNLGVIIIDEEHEWTYKQDDKAPRYHARDVAIRLAELSNACVILGSATPDVVSFYKAERGEYHLLELKERVTPRGYSPLPEVCVVDLKEELKAGNLGLFSRPLLAAIEETLARREQIILFLNRRGTATFVRCGKCGFVFRCPRCSVALTYHSIEKQLICHRCRYILPLSSACPICLRRYFKFWGIGTQRVEEEMRQLFPEARLLRWDRDVVTRRYAHDQILEAFRTHKADVLIGTQMVAKGLDLPEVTLAGIINADTGLNVPDFRSGERTFQLLCQVAGRAGRGLKAGKVIIQTYSPENYAIEAASRHDYVAFYREEIAYRQQFNYPPFTRLVRLVYSHANELRCRSEAERVCQLIMRRAEKHNMAGVSVIGPSPAFVFRVRGKYRWQLFIRSSDPVQILSGVTLSPGWTVDIDPMEVA